RRILEVVGSIDLAAQLEALRSGRAYADLFGWRKVLVSGPDARTWLNDLLSADLSDLAEGATRRSLLLSPTGRIRADVTVAATGRGLALFQDPIQPAAVDRLLGPYVLSSDVDLVDVTEDLALLAVPGPGAPPATPAEVLRPSCLGPGADLLVDADRLPEIWNTLSDLIEAAPDALEAWRIERGVARFGVDLGEDSLPQEAGLDHAVAYQKGCFLGQEAVARVRNLGHPPFVVLAGGADGPVAAGQRVTADGQAVGTVTSATPVDEGRTAAIVRVRWAARDATLRTGAGATLRPVGPASGSG
ncbi:MAG: YgfZ/GcvT domain-containing protein, partial [Actinomycetota bacterium]